MTREEVLAWVGFRVTDENGHSLGRVEDVYAVGDPEWILVRHRRSHHFLAPLRDAIGGNDQVFLPFAKETIESAPEVDAGAPASEAVIAAALTHYGLD
jgi:ribosomal 30S subunit maturation factor RimM